MAPTTAGFDTAVERFRALQEREAADPLLNPDCGSLLMAHGYRTPRAVVFLHGITSSPLQFRDLGAIFHERGYTVLIPRMPRHGYRDRLTHEQANITAHDYTTYATQAVDIGSGLGEHLTLAGLSVSGVTAAWAAQVRPEVDLAVLIAPSFAPFGMPMAMVPGVTRLARRLPNAFVWWDPRKRAALGPTCGYPRFSTHALAETFRLGPQVYEQARLQPPCCSAFLVITNALDVTVNNSATRAVLRRWSAHKTTTIREYTFGRQLGRLHDFIAPYQPSARVDFVYPILFDLIDSVGA